ncbi:hypothetical protein [Microbulbifer sp. SSSA005]|uniref:hypothetical protein n=1 Tax=Microbulbifer sp. SSSA005 TaxID=3243378 RepID=UPI00403968C6
MSDDYSALWFCAEKESDLSHFLGSIITTFNSFVGFFWLAFSGGTGSPKILERKRSFGHWSISNGDVVSKHDSLDEKGNPLYSDIAQIKTENIDLLAQILKRSLFGVDSALFFLPSDIDYPPNDLAKPLADLLNKRNGMEVIEESVLNQGLLEGYITEIVSIGGIATVTVRDSNMCTMVVSIGNQFALSRVSKQVESKLPEDGWKHIVNEQEFNHVLSVGVSVSAFS